MIEIVRLSPDYAAWEELLALIASAFAYMDGTIDPPSSVHQLTPQSLQQKAVDEIGFLAIDAGQIVGCVFCKPEAPDCLYIGKLAVAPDSQGRGIGTMLLAAAETQARTSGLASLRLYTRIELIANHATFRAWGFAKTAEKTHPGFVHPTFIEMRKQLGGPAGDGST